MLSARSASIVSAVESTTNAAPGAVADIVHKISAKRASRSVVIGLSSPTIEYTRPCARRPRAGVHARATNAAIDRFGTGDSMGLTAELRWRNVFRVAALYLVSAWLVAQLASKLLPTFEASLRIREFESAIHPRIESRDARRRRARGYAKKASPRATGRVLTQA
jgi:hypothetical protein